MNYPKQGIKFTIIILLLFLSMEKGISQNPVDTSQVDDSQLIENKVIYKSWVKYSNTSKKEKGFLGELQDSSILIYKLSKNLRIIESKKIIDVKTIKEISFRENRNVERGLLYGALTGFVTGALIGFADGDDPENCFILCLTAKQKAIIGGVALSGPGAVIGGIVGSFKVRIPINGNQNTYTKQKEELMKYKF